MVEQTVVQPYNGILLNNEKKWTINVNILNTTELYT